MKLESIALHHGYESEKTTKAATTPINQTTSFTFDDTKHDEVLSIQVSYLIFLIKLVLIKLCLIFLKPQLPAQHLE